MGIVLLSHLRPWFIFGAATTPAEPPYIPPAIPPNAAPILAFVLISAPSGVALRDKIFLPTFAPILEPKLAPTCPPISPKLVVNGTVDKPPISAGADAIVAAAPAIVLPAFSFLR